MSSASMQAKANALNQRMESEAAAVLEDIERNLLRKVARESFACAVKCYDKAGSTGPSEVLEGCARNCQVPYQQSSALVQNVSGGENVGRVVVQSAVVVLVGARSNTARRILL